MFGGNSRRSSNVRTMQLFHELKQQFPAVPDHILNACIASHHQKRQQQEQPIDTVPIPSSTSITANSSTPMGHALPATPPIDDQRPIEMNDENDQSTSSDGSDRDIATAISSPQPPPPPPKRPTTLGIRPHRFDTTAQHRPHDIRPSERCKDLPRLLIGDKPPRSPASRRAPPPPIAKATTVSTPTQTTDTLINGGGAGSVNVSFNLNCSMDFQPPSSATDEPIAPQHRHRRRTSVVEVTPQQPWLQETVVSPRSYTSVNLTLRPPSDEPQPPIDITSRNSSLTYSTSSFDSQKGLQSRLQITVGPGGGGSVASVRTRPRSSYHPDDAASRWDEEAGAPGATAATSRTASSLNDLTKIETNAPVLLKQQARIERLRIELKTEKSNLLVMQKEVYELENERAKRTNETKTDAEIEKQLLREIKHLQFQCEQLSKDIDKTTSNFPREDFYQNFYSGQRPSTESIRRPRPGRTQSASSGTATVAPPTRQIQSDTVEGLRWNCPLCTFLNHPDLVKCEQCDMPRILHGTPKLMPARPRAGAPLAARNDHVIVTRPIGFVLDNDDDDDDLYDLAINVNNVLDSLDVTKLANTNRA